ncbi:hypothetical protein AVEN_218109-1 [Araneus ventricosus]|uniref:Uncharacterized protein n=1 Tax=Araneus ventricosus TaxID=182803 RepID=A0A4Y2T7G2_ARAVE|nr:hypothetical protein AVEN_218109-1 [Araneus ventricosus]
MSISTTIYPLRKKTYLFPISFIGTPLKHWALSEDDDEESPMEDCKIKDYSEAPKYSEQLKQFFLNNEDSEGLTKPNPMKIHLEK